MQIKERKEKKNKNPPYKPNKFKMNPGAREG
jgi:hypothetical protein